MRGSASREELPPRWEHQELELERHWQTKARALLWSMRTGKTRVSVEKAERLFRAGLIDCAVVLAPNGVHENWLLREVPKYAACDWRGLAWCHQERAEPWHVADFESACSNVPGDLPWLTVNSEALQYKEVRVAVGRFIAKRRFILIADESDDYGSPGSKRTHAARAIARRASFKMILTGTVVEDSPLKAFSQYELLEEGALGHRTMESFQDRYAEYEKCKRWLKGRQKVFPKLVGYRRLPELRDSMARWSSVVLREDCHDMPELLRVERSYRPSQEQLDAYETLRQELAVTLGDAPEVKAAEAAVRLVKFQQILGGYIIDAQGEVHDVPGKNPRLDALSSEVMFDPGQVIVACRFREDISRVVARLRADGHSVVEYKGGMGGKAKNHSLDEFQAGRAKVIALTPIRGLELSAADSVVWYSHTFWGMMRRQTDERGTKMGGTATTVVDFVAKGIYEGVDRYILDNQIGKRDIAEDLARGGLKRVLEEVRL